MTGFYRQLVADYGHDVTTVDGADRHRRQSAPSRPLSWGRYCALVKARANVDGRLIEPLYRRAPTPPREWFEGGRGQAWLDYWQATQPRPGTVGSPYNDDPMHTVVAWRLEIPAKHYPKGLAHLLPLRWRDGRVRARTVMRLARRMNGGYLPDMKTADLKRLSRMSGAFLRAAAEDAAIRVDETTRRLDWVVLAQWQRDVWQELPRHVLQHTYMLAKHWPSFFRLSRSQREDLCLLGAMRIGGYSEDATRVARRSILARHM